MFETVYAQAEHLVIRWVSIRDRFALMACSRTLRSAKRDRDASLLSKYSPLLAEPASKTSKLAMMRAAVKRRDVTALDEMMFEGWPIDAVIVKLALTAGNRQIALLVTGYIRFDVAWKRNSEFVRDVMRAYSEASRYASSPSSPFDVHRLDARGDAARHLRWLCEEQKWRLDIRDLVWVDVCVEFLQYVCENHTFPDTRTMCAACARTYICRGDLESMQALYYSAVERGEYERCFSKSNTRLENLFDLAARRDQPRLFWWLYDDTDMHFDETRFVHAAIITRCGDHNTDPDFYDKARRRAVPALAPSSTSVVGVAVVVVVVVVVRLSESFGHDTSSLSF
eukprot:gene2784-3573_t